MGEEMSGVSRRGPIDAAFGLVLLDIEIALEVVDFLLFGDFAKARKRSGMLLSSVQ